MALSSCSSSCSSTVRAALRRTALMTVQQRRRRRHDSPFSSSWARIAASAATATTTTATSVSRGEASAAEVLARCSSTITVPQLISMATTTNRIGGDLPSSSSSSSSSSPATTALSSSFPAESQPPEEQQEQSSDISMQSPSSSSSSSSSSRRSKYRLSEMSQEPDLLDQIPNSSIHLLQDLVQQLEEDWSILTCREDVSLIVRPLLNVCLRMKRQYTEAAADLAERILFTCLARLPPSVGDRYPNINNDDASSPSTPPSADNSNENTCITTTTTTTTTSSSSYPYPDADVYLKVMLVCGNLRTLAAAERVNRLFRLMISEYRAEVQYLANLKYHQNRIPTESSWSSSPTTTTPRIVVPQAPAPRMQTFKTLLRAYAVSGTLQGALYAHEILNVMQDLSGSSSSQSTSSRGAAAAGGGVRSSPVDFLGGTIEGVSLRLEKPPDLTCFNSVLAAYSNCCSIQDYHHHHAQVLKRARLLWERMNDLQQEQWLKHKPSKSNVDYFQLDWFSYYPMLRIYHNHVLALLQEPPRNAQSSPQLRPSSFSIMDNNNNKNAMVDYGTLLQEIQNIVLALAQSTTIPATVPRCYRVLSRRHFDEGEKYCNNEEEHPITWAYQVLVQALVLPQPCNYNAHDDKKSGNNNELLELKRIQQAHAIVMALAGQRVDGMDSKLCPVYSIDDDEGEDVVWPSQDIILDVILAWERLALALKKAGYGPVATAAAAADIPERVQQLVKVAVDAPYKSLPDFHQAIDYWKTKSQWKNAPFVNQAIIERLLREQHMANYSEIGLLIPTSLTFAMVMWSWMESQSPLAPYKVEWLFDRLILLYERTHSDRYLPNGTHVHLLLSSWIRHCPSGARFDGKSGTQLLAAQHVTRLLQSLDMPTKGECGHAWKNQLLHARHFGIALKAWARQRIHKDDNGENGCYPDQAHEAFTLWKQLVDSTNSIPPLIYCNNVLEACVNASADAHKIYLSANGGDNDEREMKRRQAGHYTAAVHVYRHTRDHEVKNKDKKDKQRLRRDTFSYVLILQAWKLTRIVLPNQVVDDPIQFVLEIMEDCCTEGLLTQTLCFEIVELLLLFASDDNMAKTTLVRLFGVSESAAVAILQAAPVNLVREPKSSKLLWQGTNKPSGILIQNLPSAWTRNTDFGKVWQEGKNRPLYRKGG